MRPFFLFLMQMNRVDTCLKRGGVLSWGLAGNGGQGASSKPGVHMHRGGLLRTTRQTEDIIIIIIIIIAEMEFAVVMSLILTLGTNNSEIPVLFYVKYRYR